jgi:hypothetical protein
MSDSEISQNEEIISLQEQIQLLKDQSNLLLHRVDTIQECLEQDSFDLAYQSIRVTSNSKASSIHKLLDALELSEDGLTIGKFLKALNLYLIHNKLVDLNDLQIHLNPILTSAFQKAPGVKKIPYGLLLHSLPKLFI